MKVRELIEILSTKKPDAELVLEGNDHSYVRLEYVSASMAEEVDRELYEYDIDTQVGAKLVPVVILG